MARQGEVHLSPEEIERLSAAGGKTGGGEGRAAGEGLEELQAHASACAECQGRVRMYEEEAKKWCRLLPAGKGRRNADCPAEDIWLQLAAGLIEEPQAAELLRHAAGCDFCGPVLARAAEDLSPGLTREEEQTIAGLESARGDWARRMGQRLAQASAPVSAPQGSPARGERWTLNWLGLDLRWSFAAAAAVLLTAAGLWWHHLIEVNNPNRLLAEAFTEQRTLDMRFPGAKYGPTRSERGSKGRARLDRPEALLEAEAQIKRGVTAHPNDPAWIGANGRAELLEWDYEAAASSFKRALELQPDSESLRVDLALAYFERAEAEDRPIDYGAAIELLGQALAKEPGDPVALFNRAIVFERMLMYHQAIEDWDHLLKIEPRGGWAAEAAKHLEACQKQLLQKQSSRGPIADPAKFLAAIKDTRSATGHSPRGEPGFESEDYLDVAVTQWLPMAFPETEASADAPGREAAKQALGVLASALIEQHQDRWLGDLLAPTPSRPVRAGIAALGQAVSADLAGDHAMGLREAEDAVRFFQEGKSIPGMLRGKVEQVYALHRSQQGDRCLEAGRPFQSGFYARSYPWARGQLLIELAICRGMVGNLGEAVRGSDAAMKAAEVAKYRTLYLRAVGMAASMKTEVGSVAAAWSQNHQGLEAYWQGRVPPVRAFQFYSDLVYYPEQRGQWSTALPLAREAAAALATSGNVLATALAHHRLGAIAQMAGDAEEARRELQLSEGLFKQLPPTTISREYQAFGEISLAQLESEHGDKDGAIAQLQHLKGALPEFHNYLVPLQWYRCMGKLSLARSDYATAERNLTAAANISEAALESLPNERERLEWELESAMVFRDLVDIRLRHNHDPQRALQLWEWFRASSLRVPPKPQPGSSSPGLEPIDFAKAEEKPLPALSETWRRMPPPTGTLIVTVQLPQGIAIWTLGAHGKAYKFVPIAESRLAALIKNFLEACANPRSEVATSEVYGRGLYSLLIAPIAGGLLPGRTLVIEPDGALAALPFQALPRPQGGYLGDEFPIEVGIGIASGTHEGQRITSGAHALIVAAPAETAELAASLVPLPDAIHEGQMVMARFKSADYLEGRAATALAVEKALPHAQVFHFAGHSFNTAEFSGFLLAAPEAGDASAISRDLLDDSALNARCLGNCQLAVLSSCATGGSAAEGANAAPNLVFHLLSTGVPYVLASRWNVDSAATALFMDAFYAHLLAGGSVSDAVRNAMEGVRKNSKMAHPYYWAAFSTYGRS